MLGRTANGLFWMCRYLERAEHTARLLDAGLRMALTRDMVTAEEEWRSVIQTAGQRRRYEARHATYTGMQAWNYLLRERDNPGSVLAMLGQVRQNARMVRNAISRELWSAINESWLQISEMLARPVSESRVGEVIAEVRRAGVLAHGAMEGAMLREEGYHFARAGTFIERAEGVARILDIKYYLLLPSLSWVGSSLDVTQWDSVLRSVSGDRAYRWLNAGQVDPRGVSEFLILDARFPRSLAFCHAALADSLAALARMHGHEAESHKALRAAGARLDGVTIDEIFENGLHQFLTGYIAANAAVANAIVRDYRFVA